MAFGFDDDQLDELTAALRERLDSLPLHPHQRLGPPPLKGTDHAGWRGQLAAYAAFGQHFGRVEDQVEDMRKRKLS